MMSGIKMARAIDRMYNTYDSLPLNLFASLSFNHIP